MASELVRVRWTNCEAIVEQLESVKGVGGAFNTLTLAIKAIVALKNNLDGTENAPQKVVREAASHLLDAISKDKESSLSEVTVATVEQLDELEDIAEDELKGWLERFLDLVGDLIDITIYF